MIEKDEIKDFLEMNMDVDTDKVVDYVYNLKKERDKYYESTLELRDILSRSVSKDRYNNIVKKYNDLLKKRGIK